LVPPQSRHPSPESTLISGINHFSAATDGQHKNCAPETVPEPSSSVA
jgi:hypothetical protein